MIGASRPTIGRIVGFPFASPGKRGQVVASTLVPLLRKSERDSSADGLAIGALLALVTSGRLDRAADKLEVARSRANGDAAVVSDLAAVYLERARQQGSMRDSMLALEAAETAVARDASLPEAWFNRALAAEGLFLLRAARASWDHVLELEAGSPWAEEAKARRRALPATNPWAGWRQERELLDRALDAGELAAVRHAVQAYREATRLYGEVELLGSWAAAELRGDKPAARRSLARARALGDMHAAMEGDLMLRDAVAAVDRAAGDSAMLDALARGHQLFVRASASYESYQSARAAVEFAGAIRLLSRGGSPFYLWSEFYLVACAYQRSDYSAALARLDAAEKDFAPERYPALAARAQWCRGLIHYIRAQLGAAIKCYLDALDEFQRVGEEENAAAVEALLAETYGALGDEQAELAHLERSLVHSGRVRDLRRRQQIFQTAARTALDAGFLQTAYRFDEEALRAARSARNPVPIALVLQELAEICQQLGRHREAAGHIAAAADLARQAGDLALTADVMLAGAKIKQTDDPTAAISALDETMGLVERTDYRVRLTKLYLRRGELEAATGHLGKAVSDFEAGIRQLGATSTSLDPGLRATFLDNSSELFDQMVQLEARTESPPYAGSFRNLERERALSLSTWRPRGPESERVPDLSEVARTVPAELTLVEYAVLPDRTITWIAGRGAVRAAVLPLGEDAAGKLVAAVRGELTRTGKTGAAGERLHRAILAPLGLPAHGSTLLVVPDKVLYQVPFSALRNSRTGHYLVEDYALVLSPSASAYLRGTANASARDRAPAVFAVGDPAFDAVLAPGQQRLPGAQREVIAVASLYREAEVVTGVAATKERFFAGLATHAIVHFAGHAQSDARHPLFSRLLLAQSRDDPGALFAHELFGRWLPRTKLVILSSCDTAAGQASRTEGASSLVLPFLADGVQAVLASLWEVEDQTGVDFALAFHRSLKIESNFSRALRAAQLQMLHSAAPELNAPRAWAGFQLYEQGAASRPRRQKGR